ncbi:MAG: acetyl-coenzyme A synthetase, partial [Thermoplasmata archaeon]
MAHSPPETPAKEHTSELTEAEIAVHWKEEEGFIPQPKFIGQANLTDPAVNERFSLEHFPECFREFGDMLTWDKYWTQTLDSSNA